MIKIVGEVLINGAKEVGKLAVKQGPKLLSALISALIVIILEEISKFYLKRKLHKLYYNEGFKDGQQLADKLKQKLDDIIKDKNLNDKEKLRRLKKYRAVFKEITNINEEFVKEWDSIQKDGTITDIERNKKLEEIQKRFHKKMEDLGIL